MPWVSRDSFHWVDYLVFSVILIISLFIGSISAFVGKKQTQKDEFVMGGKSMSVLPASLSMVMSFMSAILVLGAPAEMYAFGTMYWIVIFSIPIGCALVAIFIVPLMYPLNLISAYEYLELRFKSKSVKLMASAFLVISNIIYIGIATFSPSTALEAATGFPTWASILCVGVIATVYSTLGGLKGTIWSSVFQGVIMIGGVLAVVIAGSIKVGGLARVWEINQEWDRIEFLYFNPDPTVRNTFWTIIVGVAVSTVGTYGTSQASVQRYCSLPTQKKAIQCVMWNSPFAAILVSVTCLSGIIMFAYFASIGCDPMSDNLISNPNQLLPHFIMETMAWPGFPGLFVSTLFAGSLSTVAAALSAMASVTWEDFLKWKWHYLSDAKQTMILKLLIVIFGILGTGMAFVTQLMGGHVMQASASFVGAVMAPMLGLFILGGFFVWANWIGALAGGVAGLIMPMWISTGAYILNLPAEFYPMPTANCSNYVPAPTEYEYEPTGLEVFYTISYLWYTSIGMATTVIVGLIVSFATGATKSHEVPKKYLIPFFDQMFCCFPERWRAKCRCGYTDDEDEDEEIIVDSKKELKSQTSYMECVDHTSGGDSNGHVSKGVEMNKKSEGEPTLWNGDSNPVYGVGKLNEGYDNTNSFTKTDDMGRLSTYM